MTEVILFHHAQGLTDGVRAFADELRAAGHTVTVPDLYDGATFATLDEGIEYAGEIGFATVVDRGQDAVDSLPNELVYAGFSLGAMPAQMLAQTRPNPKGALLFHACIDPKEFGMPWPEGVPVQIHAMEEDELFVEDGDLDAARGLVKSSSDAELFLYPGLEHLFADSSLPSYDEAAAALLMERVLSFLAAVG